MQLESNMTLGSTSSPRRRISSCEQRERGAGRIRRAEMRTGRRCAWLQLRACCALAVSHHVLSRILCCSESSLSLLIHFRSRRHSVDGHVHQLLRLRDVEKLVDVLEDRLALRKKNSGHGVGAECQVRARADQTTLSQPRPGHGPCTSARRTAVDRRCLPRARHCACSCE